MGILSKLAINSNKGVSQFNSDHFWGINGNKAKRIKIDRLRNLTQNIIRIFGTSFNFLPTIFYRDRNNRIDQVQR